jgi:uncharacterized protein YdaU (DUF1376 family)
MSANNRWMPFYIADYLGDTVHLTTQQHGAYMLLLMHYWRSGPLPDDDAFLASVVKADARAWKLLRGVIRSFFTAADGMLHQKRMDMERGRWADLREKRSSAGKAGADAKHHPNGHDKPPGKRMANAKQTDQQNGGTTTKSANTPVPVPREVNTSFEEKEAACACEGHPNSRVAATVAEVAKALKTKPPPFTPSVVYQRSALEPAPRRLQPQDPIMTVEEQMVELHRMMAEEAVAKGAHS